MGYAGGTKDNPTYHSLGNHSETIEIDYDPDVVSYETLLEVFWETNEAARLPFSRQYYSIIFYHDEAQRQAAESSYKQQKEIDRGTVETEIVPYTKFYRAEDYHQKYYLQNDTKLMKGISGAFSSFDDFVDSTAVARLEGYAGGNGDLGILERDIDAYGLTEDGKARLLEVAKRGIQPVCGTGVIVPDL